MRIFTVLFLFLVSLSTVSAQNRAQAIADYESLKQKAESLEKVILAPSKEDSEIASRENLNVFRILPRGNYPEHFFNRGGGAYYSFAKKSHSYNETPQIELQQNNLSVGFAGADFGFIADLGENPLSEMTGTTRGVSFLADDKLIEEGTESRNKYYKNGRDFVMDEVNYQQRLPAVVGHSYVLRAVNFRDADTLVVFKIHRKDDDGSLIIFWKLIKNFGKPTMAKLK